VRILHVITTLDVGGAEMHLLAQTRGQVARGHAVRVAYLKGAGSLADDFRAAGAEAVLPLGGALLPLRLWRATDRRIVLTRGGLFDSDGRCIARLADIAEVDRGVFAFKPSGGFVLRLTHAPGRDWAPGLWWRLGHRLGVGGVTGNMQGRAMAEMIALVLADRDGTRHGSEPNA